METKPKDSAFAKAAPQIGHPATNFPEEPRFFAPPPIVGAHAALSLDSILPDVAAEAEQAGALVFHAVGDTGGIHGAETQNAVAAAMQDQIEAHGARRPRFLFHLGDIVYLNGESSQYVSQFYEPYQYYDAPIFAVPGNHDGESTVAAGGEPSLHGFTTHFCSPAPSRYFKYRPAMTQPYCYWRLVAPFVHIIGLYSNIDGQLDCRDERRQLDWFIDELRAVPHDKWLVVAAHHPCLSLDETHGGYVEIMAAMDEAFAMSGRTPDLVLSGHVHAYQRFSRDFRGRALAYVVAGNGGFANTSRSLHKMQRGLVIDRLPFATALEGVRLEHYDVMNAGFLRITAAATFLQVDYFPVSFDDPPAILPHPADSVTIESGTMKRA